MLDEIFEKKPNRELQRDVLAPEGTLASPPS